MTYLPIEDLIRTSLVSKAFRRQSQKLLTNLATWNMERSKGFIADRDIIWKHFIKHQNPQAFFIVKGKIAQDIKVTPTKPVSIKNANSGFFDFNYSAFENMDTLKVEASNIADYSLMNIEVSRCDIKELFSKDFLQYFSFKGLFKADRVMIENEKIEKMVMEIQQYYNFLNRTQAFTVIVCFIYVVMKQSKIDVQRVVGMLLDSPYHLRKLYADDYYLLNLIIFQTDYLIQQKIPELRWHLKEQGIDSHDFMVDWVLTLLTYQVI